MKSGKERKKNRKPLICGLTGLVDSGTSFLLKHWNRRYDLISKNKYRKRKRYGVEVES